MFAIFITIWLYDGEKKFENIRVLVSTQYTNVTDRQTDRRTDTARQHRPRAYT